MEVNPGSISAYSKNIVSINDAVYDSRNIPNCVELHANIINSKQEQKLIRTINPNYPKNPDDQKTIFSLPEVKELRQQMASGWKSFIYDLAGLSTDKTPYVFVAVQALSPEDTMNWKSDGLLVILSLGSDVVMNFRKKSTKQIFNVFIPRCSLLVIKDSYLEYERSISDEQTYFSNALFGLTKVKRSYRYTLIWALSTIKEKYSYQIPSSLSESLFTTSPFNIDIDTNNQSHISSEDIAEWKKVYTNTEIMNALMEYPISFPYMKYYMKKQISSLFSNLQSFNYMTRIDIKPYKILHGVSHYNTDLFPYTFTDKNKSCTIVNIIDDYSNIDCITNYFTEDIRMQTSSPNSSKLLSPHQWWYSDWKKELYKELVEKNESITSQILHNKLPKYVEENTLFNTTLAFSIIKLVSQSLSKHSINILDINAEWGDRLIAAYAAKCSRYLGYNPNTKLMKGYSQLIETLNKEINPIITNSEICYEYFEKTILPKEEFDLIFVSPIPYHNAEMYSSYETWLVKYLFTSLKKAWNVLKPNGIMAIHLTDTKYMPNVCSLVNLYVQSFLPFSSYKGVISNQIRKEVDIELSDNPRRPIWIWKKSDKQETNAIQESVKRLKKFHSNILNLL
jgi:hypothetical protein